MRKPAFCIYAKTNKRNREADQRLFFGYIDSTIPLLPKSEISSLYPSSVSAQPGSCRTVFFFLHIFIIFYAYFKSKVQISCAADQHLCFHYMDSAIPFFLNPNFSASRAKKEVCVFSVTSPKNRVGRPLLNFFSKVLFSLLTRNTTDAFLVRSINEKGSVWASDIHTD